MEEMVTLEQTTATPARGRLALTSRGLTAYSVLLSGVVHLQLWSFGAGTGTPVAPAFLANAIGALTIGLALLLWRHRLVPLAAIGFAVATLGAFVISVTVGLFGPPGPAAGTPQLLAAGAEVAAIVFAAVALLAERPPRREG